MEQRYFRKGLGRREEILPVLEQDYRSGIVEWFHANGHRLTYGETTLILAREFGFCYGVDRAVEYAYESRKQFPDRRIFITGEIIHNPWVNGRLQEIGIERLPRPGTEEDRLGTLTQEDVVLIPAFGIEQPDLARLREIGSILVDTTCGSVLNVWKSVARYARTGFTAIVHGKVDHEETRATCSQVVGEGGAYLVVRDVEQARVVCDFIRDEEPRQVRRGVRGLRLPRLRSRPRSRADRARQPDDDALLGVARDLRRPCDGASSPATARRTSPSTSRASRRSAARPRTDRTLSTRCSSRESTSWS